MINVSHVLIGTDGWYRVEIRVNKGMMRLDSSHPGCCTVVCNSYTANVEAKRRTPTKEKFMIVTTGIRACVDSSKSVEVELPLKATHLCVLEIGWHDLLCKSIRFVTLKRIRYIQARTFVSPRVHQRGKCTQRV